MKIVGLYNVALNTPEGGYPPDLNCLYLISVTPAGVQERCGMNLTFEKLNMPPGPDGNCVDFIRAYNGSELREENALFPPLCGTTLPKTHAFITELDEVLIEFKSIHGGNPGQGIWGGYRRIKPGVAAQIINRGLPPNKQSVDYVSRLLSGGSSTKSYCT